MRRSAVAVLALFALAAQATASDLWRVRIDAIDAPSVADDLTSAGFDILEGSVGLTSLELIVRAEERIALEALGYTVVTLEKGRPFKDIQGERTPPDGSQAGYPDLAQIIEQMNAAQSAFPAICRVVDLTETYNLSPTFEGRHMFAVKISDNVGEEEGEPAYLLVSNHHAREIVTPVIALYAMEQLTGEYGNDPRVTDVVDNYEIWIAPTWNPDGYVEVFNGNNMWRKNKRVFQNSVGVDQNRNYPFGWFSQCSGSNDPNSATYKGPAPASEAETLTMIALSGDRNFAKVVDYHSSGREVLSGYSCHSHPFEAFAKSEAVALSTASGYGGDRRGPSAEGEHYEWQWAMHGSHAFLIESHTSFQPPYTSALAEARLVWPGVLWQLERPIPLTGYVTSAAGGEPVDALITYQGVSFPNGEENRSSGPGGRYHAFLPPRSVTVEFSAEGFVPTSRPVLIAPDKELRLDIELVPLGCSGQEVVRAKCKPRRRGNRVTAKLKKGLPGAMATFRLDRDPLTDIVKVVKNNGKAKAKFNGLSAGPHRVDIVGCDAGDNAVCP